MNGLRNLVSVLERGHNEIQIPEAMRTRAEKPLRRMLEFAAARRKTVLGDA